MRRSTGLWVATTATVVTGSFVLYYRHCYSRNGKEDEATMMVPGEMSEHHKTNKNACDHPANVDPDATSIYQRAAGNGAAIFSQGIEIREPKLNTPGGYSTNLFISRADPTMIMIRDIVSRFWMMRTTPQGEGSPSFWEMEAWFGTVEAPPCLVYADEENITDSNTMMMANTNNNVETTMIMDHDDATTIVSSSTFNDSFSLVANGEGGGGVIVRKNQKNVLARVFRGLSRRNNNNQMPSLLPRSKSAQNMSVDRQKEMKKSNTPTLNPRRQARRQNITEFFV